MNTLKIDDGIIEVISEKNTSDGSILYIETSVMVFFSQGQKKSGVENGPFALCNLVNSTFLPKVSTLVIPQYQKIIKDNGWKNDYEKLFKYLCKKQNYILIGGDHSCGQSSVSASLEKIENPEDLYVIWIDAHPDCNTMEASISKNIHGQPLAGILGFEDTWFPIKNKLSCKNLLYFGIRDIDEFERQKIEENNIYNTSNLKLFLEKITNIMETNPNAKFHVSFDVDALDPNYMISTGCSVTNGITPDEVGEIVRFVYEKLVAFDIVELNPEIGSKEEKEKSLKSIERIFEKIKGF